MTLHLTSAVAMVLQTQVQLHGLLLLKLSCDKTSRCLDYTSHWVHPQATIDVVAAAEHPNTPLHPKGEDYESHAEVTKYGQANS